MADASTYFQNYAKDKIKRLEEIRQPLLVGTIPDKPEPVKPFVPPSVITTNPSPTTKAETPATKAAVTPTTKPAATTKPAK